MLTLQDGISRGVGVDRGHVYCRVVGFSHAGQDQAVHAVEQGVGVSVMVVQQVVQVVRMVWVVRWEGVRVLMSTGQLAVVAEVVKVLVILLYGSCSREARAGAAVLPDGRKQSKCQGTEKKNMGGGGSWKLRK